jgi:tRNA-binding EMAP/Myf-like protein
VEEKKPVAGAEEKGEVPVGELAGLLDIRVGRVVKAWLHPEADTLYVEEVDVGEEQPRTICSGLVKYLSLDQLQVKMHQGFLIYSAYGIFKKIILYYA